MITSKQRRPSGNSPASESKVKQYIARVKKTDEENRKDVVKSMEMLTLEELYETDLPNLPEDTVNGETLSRTLRALKERDIVISKLRQSCSDLAIKCATAENIIDELRFGKKLTISKTSPALRKDASVETDQKVLEQPCVDWLEKVQNWRQDTLFNASHEDSCGDSGFRGSELDLKHATMNATTSTGGMVMVTAAMSTSDVRLSVPHHSGGSFGRTINNNNKNIKEISSLDPLLDEATELAKRVKEKSKRLAELLQQEQD